jgi:hypothetical protein
MAARYKRTTTKTGPYSSRTVTHSSAGTRVTTSSKPPGSPTRRTTSVNLKTGSTRLTHTTRTGGGWNTTSTESRIKGKLRSHSRKRRRKSSGIFGFKFWIFTIIIVYILLQ